VHVCCNGSMLLVGTSSCVLRWFHGFCWNQCMCVAMVPWVLLEPVYVLPWFLLEPVHPWFHGSCWNQCMCCNGSIVSGGTSACVLQWFHASCWNQCMCVAMVPWVLLEPVHVCCHGSIVLVGPSACVAMVPLFLLEPVHVCCHGSIVLVGTSACVAMVLVGTSACVLPWFHCSCWN
jgi:hypothetical protein